MHGRRAGIVSLAALLVVALLSHAVAFSGLHDCNPLAAYSGLALPDPHAAWAGGCFIDGNAGLSLQALGHRVAEDWLGLRLPWWNPYAGIGMPLAAEMQPAAFFLPFILLLHFSNGLLLLKIVMQVMAGACMLFCLRQMGLARGAALLGAALYALDGTFAWYGDAPMLPLPFLPLLAGGIEQARIAAARAQPGGIPAIAVGIGFSLLAGFPETAFLNGVLAAIWAAIRLGGLATGARWRLAGKLLVGGLAGVALAAPALVPFLDYLAGGAVTFRGMVAGNQLQAGQDAALLLPGLFGPPHADANGAWGAVGGYLGAALVLPGLSALLARGRHVWLRGLAAAWTLFWLAVFLGEPVSRHVWQALPLLNQAVVTRYAMPSVAFLWTVLAALGWEGLAAGHARPRAAALLFLALAGAAVLHAFAAGRLPLTGQWPGVVAPGLMVAWTIVVAVLFFALARRTEAAIGAVRPFAGLALAAVLLCDALACFMVPQLAGARPRPLDVSPINFLQAQPGFQRSYALDGLLEPNYGSYFGTPTLQAFTLPAPALWTAYTATLDPRLMGEMFAPASLAAQAAHLQAARAAFEDAGVGFVLVPPDKDTIGALHDRNFVTAFESPVARIYRLPGAKPYFDAGAGGACRLVPVSRVRVDAECTGPAVLLRREMFDAGWHATLNGAKAPITRADGVFQSVMLRTGTNRVAFVYSPAHARLIALLLVAAGAAIGGNLLYSMRKRRNAATGG